MQQADLGRTRRQSSKLYRNKVERAWEAMATSGQLDDQGLRCLVSESWKPCLEHRMVPESTLPPRSSCAPATSGVKRAPVPMQSGPPSS